MLLQLPRPDRAWGKTIENTHELFKIATEKSMNQANIKSKVYGVKDAFNLKILELAKENSSIQEKMNEFKDDKDKVSKLYNPFLRLEGMYHGF